MYSNALVVALLICLTLFSATSFAVDEQSAAFDIKPSKCVALHKGRTCYADIVVQWNVDKPGNYCLIATNQTEPLACWQNKQTGQLTVNFESTRSEEFSLVVAKTQQLVATKAMVVTWLHKSPNRRRRWRLF